MAFLIPLAFLLVGGTTVVAAVAVALKIRSIHDEAYINATPEDLIEITYDIKVTKGGKVVKESRTFTGTKGEFMKIYV